MYPPCVCTCKRAYDICMWVWSCAVLHVSHSGCQACTAVAQTAQSSPLRHLPGFEPTNLTPRERGIVRLHYVSVSWEEPLASDAKKNESALCPKHRATSGLMLLYMVSQHLPLTQGFGTKAASLVIVDTTILPLLQSLLQIPLLF